MNIEEMTEVVYKQLENAKVVLDFESARMRMTFEGASLATYGFIISEMLSGIAEKHPEMTESLYHACNVFLESYGSEVK